MRAWGGEWVGDWLGEGNSGGITNMAGVVVAGGMLRADLSGGDKVAEAAGGGAVWHAAPIIRPYVPRSMSARIGASGLLFGRLSIARAVELSVIATGRSGASGVLSASVSMGVMPAPARLAVMRPTLAAATAVEVRAAWTSSGMCYPRLSVALREVPSAAKPARLELADDELAAILHLLAA